jgi:mono/diheme cytochrome c family protein
MQQEHVPLKYPAVFIIVGGITILIMVLAASFDDISADEPFILAEETTVVAQVPTDTVVPTATPIPPTPTVEPTTTPVPPTATTPPTEVPPETTEPSPVPPEAAGASNESPGDYPPELIAHGETLYVSTCSACHGADATGIEGLGKNLVESEFVHSLTDEELQEFVITGRPIWDANNTTGVDMPPRGGNPALTNDDILAIIAYIRSFEPASAGGEQTSTTTDDSHDVPTSDAQFDEALAVEGETVFIGACSACHGMDAQGIEGLGKNLVESEFVDSLSNEELVDFVITGRPLWDANNTTGVDMPPRGGNPALTDDQIMAVIHYIRSLKG